MSFNSRQFYDFDGLRFDSENSVLIRLSDEEKVLLRGKEKLLLLSLVKKPNQTVTYEELQQAVWQEASDTQMIRRRLQVTKDTLQKKINTLRQKCDNSEVIKSVPLEGYVFILKIEQPEIESGNLEIQTEPPAATQAAPAKIESPPIELKFGSDESKETQIVQKAGKFRLKPVLIAGAGLAFLSVIFFIYFSPGEKDEIKRVVKDSQMFESLALYQNPTNFDEKKLKEYWLVEPHNSDLDATQIVKGAKNLIEKGIRYGTETKCERFDFVSVDVNESGDFAVAKTIEKWFVAKYRNDGTLIENKTIGPYSVTYNLRKSGGKWLIEKSSTARAGGG